MNAGIVKSSTSINSMRESNENSKLLLSGGGTISSNHNSNGLVQQNSVDKRTSINSYNKRVVELHLNQHKNQEGLLKVGPQTMKN